MTITKKPPTWEIGTPRLAAKIGSILVHIEEATSSKGHPLDMEAVKSGLSDPEVREWLSDLGAMYLLPEKRS